MNEINEIREENAHNLYILRMYNSKTSIIKFGYSSNIQNRLQSYFNHNPLTEIIDTYYRKNAKELEQEIHSKLDSMYKREWYSEDKLETIKELLNHTINDELVDELVDEELTDIEIELKNEVLCKNRNYTFTEVKTIITPTLIKYNMNINQTSVGTILSKICLKVRRLIEGRKQTVYTLW